jgi:hypothetical protein
MSEQDIRGYVYRRASLNEQGLRDLIAQYVFDGSQVFVFAADNIDFLEIKPYPSAVEIPVAYDFGHVFSLNAEVRWKKTDTGYDALLLAEHLIDALSDQMIGTPLNTRMPLPKAWLVLHTPEEARKRKVQWRLGYVEYIGANHTVQFTRYTQREERPE